MRISWNTCLSSLLVVCALITTGLVVRREMMATTAGAGVPKQQPLFVEDWQSHLGKGVRLGSSQARVKLIEFADFECPFCATLHVRLKELRRKYPEEVAVTFVHFPLTGHRFAEPAARAAECAGEQRRFEAMHDLLFEQQKGFGIKSWGEFAEEAAVADGAAFESCMQRAGAFSRLSEGRALGEALGIPGTPTILINGWMLRGSTPSAERLDQMVQAILAGQPPLSDE